MFNLTVTDVNEVISEVYMDNLIKESWFAKYTDVVHDMDKSSNGVTRFAYVEVNGEFIEVAYIHVANGKLVDSWVMPMASRAFFACAHN